MSDPIPAASAGASGRTLRWIEMIVLFFAGPAAAAALIHPRYVLAMLLVLTAGALVILLLDPPFDRRRLWDWRSARTALVGVGIRWMGLTALLAALVLAVKPEMFLSFPRERPLMWGAVMCLYPLVSVYPQEVVWRVYFHHRYAAIFPERWMLIAASGLAFGVMHVMFHNWIAVALSAVGGLLFAHTYENTKSGAAAWIEHAMYGCAVFTLGLGAYFYGGAVK